MPDSATASPGTARGRHRLLLLSSSVPPRTTGSAIIVGNLARQFRRDEMVVAGEQPLNSPAVHWDAAWPEIRYIYQGPPEHRRGRRWHRRAAVPGLLSRVVRLGRQFGCTALLTVFPNEEFLLVGYLAARRLGVPFLPYFHNTYLDNRTGWERRFAEWLQPRVFHAAAHVLVMSEGMVEFYRERYPELRCTALVHSFHEPLPEYQPPPPPGSALRVAISGNVNATCQDAAGRVAAALQRLPGTRLALYSGTSRAHLERLGILGDGVTLETVSRDVLLSRLAEADVVALPHGFRGGLSEAEYATIFPTKTIEYLICGRPILAHSPPGCFLTRFLRKWECALLVEEPTVEAVAAALECLRADADLRARLVRNALRAAQQFQAEQVAAQLRAVVAGESRG